jgi:D-hexose-6-phosphate mutarotase
MPSSASRCDKSFLKQGKQFLDAQSAGWASNVLWLTISPANPLKDFNPVI